MSGTSLDGLDIAYCSFEESKSKWSFKIEAASTINYDKVWLNKLQNAHKLSGEKLMELHNEYGTYLGKQVAKFVKNEKISKVDFVASHGHTIFHQPHKGFTFQLGNGASIAAASGYSLVNDFRTLDVALKGQGAPLVPIGDKLLFAEHTYCINLGGFANVSYDVKGERIAFDICPVNIVLNYLAQKVNKSYDKNGVMAAKGKVNAELLKKLNGLKYYKTSPPKSLGREWLEKEFLPIINKSKISVADKLATVSEHIAIQIKNTIGNRASGKVLVTGGGAFNSHLIERIQTQLPQHQVIIPSADIVNFKEALVFAFLGVLRWEGKDNCLKSVTGATRNNKGGTIWLR